MVKRQYNDTVHTQYAWRFHHSDIYMYSSTSMLASTCIKIHTKSVMANARMCFSISSFGTTVPQGSFLGDLVTDAIVIAIIGFVINISQARLLAKKNAYTIHPDQVVFCIVHW